MNTVCLLNIRNHLNSAGMSFSLELRIKESTDNILSQLTPDDTGAKGYDIGVIVLHRQSRGIRFAAYARNNGMSIKQLGRIPRGRSLPSWIRNKEASSYFLTTYLSKKSRK